MKTEKPILVSVLQIYAVLSIISGICVGLFIGQQNVALGVTTFAAGLGQAVLCLGIAECVMFLARTAEATERTADLLARQTRTEAKPSMTLLNKSAKDSAWEQAQRGA